jgi:DnaJ family protein B protein 13
MATHSFKFSEICEAFDVLSNPKNKAFFDQYGEEILKEGIPDGKGSKLDFSKCIELKGGYKFSGNTLEIFERFFGSGNPFTDPLSRNQAN